MKIKISNLRLSHFRLILAMVLITFSIAGVFLFWKVAERAEKAIVERIEAQELTLARSGALSITEFFQERKTELLLLAEVEAVKAGREKEGREVLANLVGQLEKGPLADVVRVNREGKALWVSNVENNREGEGVSLADRDYFIWAEEQKEPGEVFISEPIIARGGIKKGGWVVVVATPVFYQNSFNGLVFISFPVDDLTEKYITPLAFSSRTKALIITREGTVIGSNVPEAAGENVLTYPQQEDWQGREEYLDMAREALTGKEGSQAHLYHLFAPYNRQVKLITAYTSVKINSQAWSLWISTPYEEAMRFFSPFRLNQIGGIIFVSVLVLILILTLIFGVRIAHKDAFLDGYAQAKDHFDKKSAKGRKK